MRLGGLPFLGYGIGLRRPHFDAIFEARESIDFLEISFRMEESFGFPFPTDDLGNIMNSVNENSTTADVSTALDTLATDFTVTHRMIGIVTHQRRHIEISR